MTRAVYGFGAALALVAASWAASPRSHRPALARQEPPNPVGSAPTGSLPATPTWSHDFDASAARARAEGKDLLVDFTGSDWCVWCARLDAEVFAHEAFLASARARFVLVELDFPQGAVARAAVPHAERQEELRARYGVSGFPTVLLLDAAGEVFGRTGYVEGGPSAFLATLDGWLLARREIERAARRFAEVSAQAPAAAPEVLAAARFAALEVLERHGASPRAGALTAAVRPLAFAAGDGGRPPGSNPEAPLAGADARWRPTRALVAAGLVDAALVGVARELDPRNAVGLQELAVRAFVLAVRDARGAREAVAFAETLAKSGGVREPSLAVDIWSNASDWAAFVLGDRLRARWFAQLALRCDVAAGPVRERMEGRLAGG